MTIQAICDLVTDKLGRTDSDTKTLCKSLIKKRYELIYNSALWIDTMAATSESVSAGSPDITVSSNPDVFYFHDGTWTAGTAPRLDLIITIRFIRTGDSGGLQLTPGDWWSFFQLDPNQLQTGANHRSTPTKFFHLPKDSSGRPRIRLVPTPKDAGTLYILGKLKYDELDDAESPVIRGVDNALIAFAEGDMLEYEKQYGKAQLKFTEAAGAVAVMKDLQRNQNGSESRFIPVEYGDYYETEDTII